VSFNTYSRFLSINLAVLPFNQSGIRVRLCSAVLPLLPRWPALWPVYIFVTPLPLPLPYFFLYDLEGMIATVCARIVPPSEMLFPFPPSAFNPERTALAPLNSRGLCSLLLRTFAQHQAQSSALSSPPETEVASPELPTFRPPPDPESPPLQSLFAPHNYLEPMARFCHISSSVEGANTSSAFGLPFFSSPFSPPTRRSHVTFGPFPHFFCLSIRATFFVSFSFLYFS